MFFRFVHILISLNLQIWKKLYIFILNAKIALISWSVLRWCWTTKYEQGQYRTSLLIKVGRICNQYRTSLFIKVGRICNNLTKAAIIKSSVVKYQQAFSLFQPMNYRTNFYELTWTNLSPRTTINRHSNRISKLANISDSPSKVSCLVHGISQ